MIRINLLPQKRGRESDAGEKTLAIGLGALVVLGVLVYLLVHRPLAEELDQLRTTNSGLSRDNKAKKEKLADFENLKKAVAAAEARSAAIVRLNAARALPTHFLNELGDLLTPNTLPTMTKVMAARVERDPNREMSTDWDPKHVWITSITEKNGRFRLEGGAQTDGDMTQLAKRLQASVYFDEVIPEGGSEQDDRESGVTYYKFVISGKVIY